MAAGADAVWIALLDIMITLSNQFFLSVWSILQEKSSPESVQGVDVHGDDGMLFAFPELLCEHFHVLLAVKAGNAAGMDEQNMGVGNRRPGGSSCRLHRFAPAAVHMAPSPFPQIAFLPEREPE